MKKTQIGGVEIKRNYRPARIACDVISLAAIAVVIVIAVNLFAEIRFFLGDLGRASILLFPAVGVGLCAVYVILVFKNSSFKRYKITKQNAQDVYNWWVFSLSLVKIPLLIGLIEGEFMFRSWAHTGEISFSIWIVLYVLLALIIMRLAAHRIRMLTAVKKAADDDSAVKVKVRVDDDLNEK